MIDMSVLSQMLVNGEEVCFYAITCYDDKICKRKFCFPAQELYDMIKGTGVLEMAQGGGSQADSRTDAPRLMPNPTTGEVSVTGTPDEVVEVLVLDMNGRQMATFSNTDSFDISTFASGIYIVRVITRHDDKSPEEVTYLKLVKK